MLFTCLDSRKLTADNVIWFNILVIELVVIFMIQTTVWNVSRFLAELGEKTADTSDQTNDEI